MSEPWQFMCEGCGAEIYAFGMTETPGHGFCSTCHWLDFYLRKDPEEFWDMYKLTMKDVGNDRESRVL